jgi:hypothetical protein
MDLKGKKRARLSNGNAGLGGLGRPEQRPEEEERKAG